MAAEPFLRCLPVGPLQTNCYLYGSPQAGRGVIIDPGDEPDRIWEEFRGSGLALEAIVNTHAHFDHAGGNRRLKELTGAPILIHRVDAPAVTRLGAQARFFLMEAEDSPPADRLLEEGDVIGLGPASLTVRHSPGHTPGGILLVGEGLVFSGDTLFAGSVGRTDFPGGSWGELVVSIREKLLDLPDETVVYPGHGPATTIGEERRYNPFLR
jgi:glyoxylase-like metal-dependent hydrolase (beta-lactamase superfamily II)